MPLLALLPLLLLAGQLLQLALAHEKPPAPADVIFTQCDRAGSWLLPSSPTGRIRNANASSAGACLTLDGPPGRFTFLTSAACGAARQQWKYPFSNRSGVATLAFAAQTRDGDGGSTPMCVQIDGGKPWTNEPGIVWDCQVGAKDEAVTLLPGDHGGHKLRIDMTSFGAAPLCMTVREDLPPPPPPPPPAVPTAQQLAWADLEIGALFQYNMGTYGEQTNDEDCGPSLTAGVPLPPARSFDAPLLNVSQWMQAVSSFGGKYAVLTAQAGCGFVLYPSNATLPGGSRYNYTIRESPYRRDLVMEFVTEARKWGIRPGIYYILNFNAFLQFNQGKPAPKPGRGTLALTAAQYEAVVLQQLRELWGGKYGALFELWFDG
jgi:hypothetical protein